MAKTALPKRYKFDPDLLTQIEKHCYSTLEYEVGGMLFGKITSTTTQINGFVPALKASKQLVTLTFTHDVWDAILKEGEEKFPGQQIVGWYHTHPSFGIFLSDYDQFIQTEFFKQKGQVALVVDPVAGKLGWFETAGSEVKLIAADETATGPKQKKDSSGPVSAKRRPSQAALLVSTAAALVIGAGIGASVALSQTPPDITSSLEREKSELQQENEMLWSEYNSALAQLGFRDGQLVLLYTSIEGDTAESIAKQFYGSIDLLPLLTESNPEVDFDNLTIGTQLNIVGPANLQLGLPVEEPAVEGGSGTESPAVESTTSATTSTETN
jgi:proteasome lid subunit RPN8/RPN11